MGGGVANCCAAAGKVSAVKTASLTMILVIPTPLTVVAVLVEGSPIAVPAVNQAGDAF